MKIWYKYSNTFELHCLIRKGMDQRVYSCIAKFHQIALQITEKQICCMQKIVSVIIQNYEVVTNSIVKF